MNSTIGLAALGLLLAALVIVVVAASSASTRPEILAIEFPESITADGSEILGTVRFRDRDGDIVLAEFKVVEASAFEPFSFDPEVAGQKEGSFPFAIFTYLPQRVTLELTLIDRRGQRSRPKRFSFTAEMAWESQ
ncbi:MAG: hypothetical protein ACUVUT_01620 [Candidatus Bipolaricaulia bacterium]